MVEPGVDMVTLMKQIGFKPHSVGQRDYLLSTVRFNVPCCGRRWGKSQAAGHRVTHKMFVPDSYNWIIGPTYKLGEKEFRVVYSDFQKLGLLKYCRKSYATKTGDMRIQTPWKSVLEVVSAEKQDSLLGEGLDHACMSEAATHTRQVWEQFIEPALSDKLGSADFPSTPRGYNWYHGLWRMGQEVSVASASDYASWTFPSWTNTVKFPGGYEDPEIQRILSTVSKLWFDQEYAAMFTSFAGQIYPEFKEELHVQRHVFRPDWQNFLAFDYGFANPFVCLDIQVSPNDNVYVWREYYERNLSTYEHGQQLRMRSQPEGYRIDAMFGDPAGADEAATLALMLGQVSSLQFPWKLGVEEVKRLLKSGHDGFPSLYIDPSCSNLIRQVSQLHIRERKNSATMQDLNEYIGDGNLQHKVDDHATDALRYFVGQFFGLGANSHLSDIYGHSYHGSESDDFFKLLSGIILNSNLRL